MIRLIKSISSIWLAFHVSGTGGATLTFTPVYDSFVRDGVKYSNLTHGLSSQLQVKSDISGYRRISFLQFDIPDFSPWSVSSARLRLFIDYVNFDESREITIGKLASGLEWSEQNLTWNSFVPMPPKYEEIGDSITIHRNEIKSWVEIAIDNLFGIGKLSLVLENMGNETTTTNDVSFASKEQKRYAPHIVVELTAPPPSSSVFPNATIPTPTPNAESTFHPTTNPSAFPMQHPTNNPTNYPTKHPTNQPSYSPTSSPTLSPTNYPTQSPTHSPTNNPTKSPSSRPSASPSFYPSVSSLPSRFPSDHPSVSTEPSSAPSDKPSVSAEPSAQPSFSPSHVPTTSPSNTPSFHPSLAPSEDPSNAPTSSPSSGPSSEPTESPSISPSSNPSSTPSKLPTGSPSSHPSNYPSNTPSSPPTSINSVKLKASLKKWLYIATAFFIGTAIILFTQIPFYKILSSCTGKRRDGHTSGETSPRIRIWK